MTILEFIKEIEKRLWSVVACHKIGTTSSDLMWNLWKDDKDFRLQIFCKNTDIHRLL